MKEKLHLVMSAKFGLILVIFLMPFINVSCSNMVNIPISGMDLATGTTLETHDPFSGRVHKKQLAAEPYATVALVAAIAGLLFGFVKARPARMLNAAAGGVGVVFLLLLKHKIDHNVMAQGGGLIAVNYDVGYWMAVLLFLAAVAVGIYAVTMAPETNRK